MEYNLFLVSRRIFNVAIPALKVECLNMDSLMGFNLISSLMPWASLQR